MSLQHLPLISNVSFQDPANKTCKSNNLVYFYILLYIYRDIRLRIIYFVCSRNTSCREAPKINKYVKQKNKYLTGVVVKRPVPV